MTYEMGQKVLVEATIVNPTIDSDGDVKVCLYGDSDDWTYASAASIREMSVGTEKTKVISFPEVTVGDVVRVTQRCADGTEVISTGTVTSVPSINLFRLGDDRAMWLGGIEDVIELISRPEPIKVGDMITGEQAQTLPVGSVVAFDDDLRMVTRKGLYNPMSDESYEWRTYRGVAGITVKCIAK